MNPIVRGLLIIAAVAAVIVVLQLYQTLVVLTLIAQIGFLLAIALFVYLVWRERRAEIGEWSTRAQVAFYGAAILIVVRHRRLLVRAAGRAGRGGVPPRALPLRVHDVPHVARPAHVRLRRSGVEAQARALAAAPSSASRASRIPRWRPTKIGVSRSV